MFITFLSLTLGKQYYDTCRSTGIKPPVLGLRVVRAADPALSTLSAKYGEERYRIGRKAGRPRVAPCSLV